MPIIVVCNVFQERLAFYGKYLLSSFVMCFKSVWHFTGSAFVYPEFMLEERLAFGGNAPL